MLIARGGQVSLIRRMAAGVWGPYKIESGPDLSTMFFGRNFDTGFIAMPDSARNGSGGLFARRFVRENLDIPQFVSAGTRDAYIADTITSMLSTTGGDVSLDRAIDRSGLGRLVPYEDFTVGSVLPVQIWDLKVNLPVAKIETKTAAGAVVDWAVHVGGVSIRDRAGLAAKNQKVLDDVAREREQARDALSTAQGASATASRAAANASAARKAANDTKTALSSALKALESERERAADSAAAAEAAAQQIDNLNRTIESNLDTVTGKLELANKLADGVTATKQEVDRLVSAAGSSISEINRLMEQARALNSTMTSTIDAARSATGDAHSELDKLATQLAGNQDMLARAEQLGAAAKADYRRVLAIHGIVLKRHDIALNILGRVQRITLTAVSANTSAIATLNRARLQQLQINDELAKAQKAQQKATDTLGVTTLELSLAVKTLGAVATVLANNQKMQAKINRQTSLMGKYLAAGVAANARAVGLLQQAVELNAQAISRLELADQKLLQASADDRAAREYAKIIATRVGWWSESTDKHTIGNYQIGLPGETARYVKITGSGFNFTATAIGRWVGTLIVEYFTSREKSIPMVLPVDFRKGGNQSVRVAQPSREGNQSFVSHGIQVTVVPTVWSEKTRVVDGVRETVLNEGNGM